MKSNRRTAFFLGLLLIFSFIFGILSSVPALEKPDYLKKLSEIEMQVLIAVFFQGARPATLRDIGLAKSKKE